MSFTRKDTLARRWALLNALLTTALIVWNYWAGSGKAFGRTVGEISRHFDTTFTPANYAFGIWGLIYISLVAQAGFHLKRTFFDNGTPKSRTDALVLLGPRMAVAQALCGAWLVAWLTESLLLSLLVITGLFVTLLSIVRVWNMERWDAPAKIIVFEWWPICWYSGWIFVALLANAGSALSSLGFSFVLEAWWAIVLAVLLTAGNLAAIFLRNMREFSLVAVWALGAVAYRHWETPLHAVSLAALTGASILLVASVIHGAMNFTMPPKEVGE